jgi:hypothetical protein
MGVMACPPPGPLVPVMQFESIDEPAETPLPPPTAEQLEQIHERLTSP